MAQLGNRLGLKDELLCTPLNLPGTAFPKGLRAGSGLGFTRETERDVNLLLAGWVAMVERRVQWTKPWSLTLNLSFFIYKMGTLITPTFFDFKRECAWDTLYEYQEVTSCAWRPRLLLPAS